MKAKLKDRNVEVLDMELSGLKYLGEEARVRMRCRFRALTCSPGPSWSQVHGACIPSAPPGYLLGGRSQAHEALA